MTALVLGYTAPGRTAEPTVLYAGTDAGAASEISLAPPAGFVRTELIKNPVITRRRFFEAPEYSPEEPEETPLEPDDVPPEEPPAPEEAPAELPEEAPAPVSTRKAK